MGGFSIQKKNLRWKLSAFSRQMRIGTRQNNQKKSSSQISGVMVSHHKTVSSQNNDTRQCSHYVDFFPQIRSLLKQVSLSMSRHFIFGSSAVPAWARGRSLLLFDLSYSPDLALTLMSARMRGARACKLIHESQRFRSKADGLYFTAPAGTRANNFWQYGKYSFRKFNKLWKLNIWYTLMLNWYKIKAHKRLFRALGTNVLRNFGHSPISLKVRGNTAYRYFIVPTIIVELTVTR